MGKSLFIQQKIANIQDNLGKPITEFQTGGFRSENERQDSWLGRVFICRPTEASPVNDQNGNPLYALAQFYLPALPYIPEQLKNLTYLTVFIGDTVPELTTYVKHDDFSDIGIEVGENGNGWLIREYTSQDDLIEFEFPQQDIPKTFPLKPFFKEQDFPLWDGGGVPYDLEKEICSLDNFGDEDNPNKLNYYEDIVGDNHSYQHKFGGYPSFCQSGISIDGFEFMFQISSDEKANFNVIDGGSLLFFRNQQGQWRLYYDFY